MNPIIVHEKRRLQVLRSYGVLDTLPERALDDLTKLAAHICEAPMALISLVDVNRQWFKSCVGLEVVETPLEVSFCVHALHQTELLIVPDATRDLRFAENALVTGGPKIRFYAGAPLLTPEGAVLGTLCVVDQVVRELRPDQRLALEVLSRQVMTHLELHRQRLHMQAGADKLQAIFDAVPECIQLLQGDGTVLEMNRAGLKLVDAESFDEVLGRSMLPLVVPDDREKVRTAVADAAAPKGVDNHFRFEILTPKGVARCLEMMLVPFTDTTTGQHLALTVSRDVTQRNLADERLRRSEASLANAQRMARMGNWDFDVATRELHWSDQVHEIFGVEKTGATTSYESFLASVHPEDQERMHAAHVTTMNGGPRMNLEHRIVLPDGTEKIVHEQGDLQRDAAGRATHLSGTVQDITERKLLEQHVLRAQRMDSLGTLAGGMAHDLNNALTPILMSLALLKMKFPDEKSHELITVLDTSAQRAADMVRQVLAFARGVEGERQELQVADLLHEVMNIARDTFPKNIRVEASLPPKLWPVRGDATQLHQVLVNLCVNARDAMGHGGTLKLAAENLEIDSQFIGMHLEAKAGRYVLLQIADTGCGMSSAVLERMFDPFFTTKEMGKGTGLGLASALAIVRSHGGFIRTTSAVGKGTKFNVYFPASDGMTSSSAQATVELPEGNGELILVVDDESSVREVTRQTLEAFGYRVLVATDGADAVAVFASHRESIAVMLTDMMMPVMDGPELIKIVRHLSPELPILAASGVLADDNIAALGVHTFLPKPYTAEKLLKILAGILKNGSDRDLPGDLRT